MIYNLLDNFRQAYSQRGDDLIIENHNLKEGLYLRIKENNEIKSTIITKESTKDKNYEWLRKADFYSEIINTNKSVSDKKIHSCNYLSLLIKKKTIIGDEKDTLSREVILEKLSKYYEVLASNKFNSDKITKDLGQAMNIEKYNRCREFVINNYDDIYKVIEGHQEGFTNYIKIFFDFNDWEVYKLEANRYLYQKVFNSSDYNISIDDKLYGLSNMNMGLNAKKPFLEHKTLMCNVPYLIEVTDALLLYKYSKWLSSNKLGPKFKSTMYDYKAPLNEENDTVGDKFYLYFTNKNGEIEFTDFDIIPAFKQKIDFAIKNHVYGSYYDKESKTYVSPSYSQYNEGTRKAMLDVMNEKMFMNTLKRSFYNQPSDIKPPHWGSKKFCNLLILCGQHVFSYINKDDDLGIKSAIDKYFRFIVLENIKKSRRMGLDACNVYISLKKYFDIGGKEVVERIKDLRENIIGFIEGSDNHDLEDISQYSFLAGQIAYYLISQSKAANKTHDLIERVVNNTEVESLNRELKYWFKRYGHGVSFNYKRFNKAFSMVLAFDKELQVDEDIFLAGYLGDNIFYSGKEEKSYEIK